MTTQQVLAATYGVVPPWPTEAEYTVPGTYTWTVPNGISTTVAVLCVGGSAMGRGYHEAGGGGGLGYKNSINVSAGQQYTVVVGERPTTDDTDGGDSYFDSTSVCKGGGGQKGSGSGPWTGGAGGTYTGDGGGNGGKGGDSVGPQNTNYYPAGGGAGAGGYSGAGGEGCPGVTSGSWSGWSGNGGGGGGGASGWDGRSGHGNSPGGGGGGVGLYGQGSSGAAGQGQGQPSTGTGGIQAIQGHGGSGGEDGGYNFAQADGGNFGGSKSSGYGYFNVNKGCGAVRILWDGNGHYTSRSFPYTNVNQLGDR